MFDSTYLLLKLFDQIEQIQGRKKLQKMVHLLTVSGTGFPFKFQYHFYGPYSSQLQDEVIFLVQQGFLEEFKEDDTYVYRITERGKEFKDNLENSHTEDLDQTLVRSMHEQSSQFLEMVSTYAFLIDSGYDAQGASRKSIELKPHLSGYANEAKEFFHKSIAGFHSTFVNY